MALESAQLDTLTWDQMVSALRTRIVPDSQGQWTLHAPVDPGVTLLELFAWLLEQRVYWMDQLPDSLIYAVLALLGQAPEPAKAASTLLQLSPSPSVSTPFPTATAGTPMRLQDSNPPLIFTLDDDLTLLPIERVAVSVNGVDRTGDLQQGRLVPLLSSGKNSGEVTITLSLSGDAKIPAAPTAQFFSLMFELETPAAVPAQWAADAVDGVPAPATLSWSYRTSNGAVVALPPAQVSDSTAGLRRSGVVRLPLQSDWQPEAAGADPSITSYALVLQIQSAGYTVVPRLVRLLPNVVLAHHRWPQTKHPATKGWLPLPGNVVSLPDAPGGSGLREPPPLEDTVEVEITEPDGQTYTWKREADLSFSGPSDRVFMVDRARSQVRFGDGLTGRLPLVRGADTPAVKINYAAGGGPPGNVGQNLSWAILQTDSKSSTQFTAINPVAGDGGRESEALAAARQRVTGALNERNRAVSKVDYENLAQTTPGVAFRRAYAAIGHHPDFPCATVPGAVTVYVVPYAPRVETDGEVAEDAFVEAPLPDPGALEAARARLSAGRLIGSDIFVLGPVYRSVWLGLDIASDAALPTGVRQQIVAGLQKFLDPLVGGDDAQGWPFGDPLRPSALLRVAQRVLGSAGDVLGVSVRLNRTDTAEGCKDVPIQPHELVKPEHVDIRTQRRTAPPGGLR